MNGGGSMEYITETLGVPVMRKAWTQESLLPYLLIDQYTFEQVNLGNTACLFVHPCGKMGVIGTLLKHVDRLQAISGMTVVFELPSITRQRRGSLIEARIPFVVPNKQLYLPFMGLQLTENFNSEQPALIEDRLQPSTQMLLFSFILGGNKPMPMAPLADRFDFSAMTITRAANQLAALGQIKKVQQGVQKLLVCAYTPKELYTMLKPQLIDPRRRTIYISKDQLTQEMFPSGLSALAEMSLLNPPAFETFGIAGHGYKPVSATEQFVDADKQCALQLWRYDPRRISQSNAVDVLSLATSFAGETDERIEQCLSELLKGIW